VRSGCALGPPPPSSCGSQRKPTEPPRTHCSDPVRHRIGRGAPASTAGSRTHSEDYDHGPGMLRSRTSRRQLLSASSASCLSRTSKRADDIACLASATPPQRCAAALGVVVGATLFFVVVTAAASPTPAHTTLDVELNVEPLVLTPTKLDVLLDKLALVEGFGSLLGVPGCRAVPELLRRHPSPDDLSRPDPVLADAEQRGGVACTAPARTYKP
jgi:hypothetical protein